MHDDELLPSVRAFGDDLVRAARAQAAPARAPRARLAWRSRRTLLIAVLTVLVAGGVAGAVQLISVGEPAPNPESIPAISRAGGARATAVVRAPDAAAHGSWGVSVYRSRQGLQCALAGFVRGGFTLGEVRSGTFRPYAATRTGSCADLTGHGSGQVLAAVAAFGEPAPRWLLFGRARPGVRTLDVTLSRIHRRVRTGAGGAFLLVFDVPVRLPGARIRPLPAGG